jgi:hypothetical protein
VVSGDVTSEADELTIAALAMIEGVGVTKAEIRRRLLAGACALAREDPHVAVIVEAALASRDARRDQARNVVRLAGRRRT